MMLFGLLTWLACADKCDSTFTDLLGDDIDQNCDGIDGTDGDGDGVASWQSGGSDCDDTDPTVSSGSLVYQDLDQDGFGNPNLPIWLCDGDDSMFTSTLSTDCNDFNANIHPDHPEICDMVDNDCDTLIDSADNIDDPSALVPHFSDLDGDGYGSGEAFYACLNTPETSLVGTDCDDNDASIAPDQPDTEGDSTDSNCDGADNTVEACSFEQCDHEYSVFGTPLSMVYVPVHGSLEHTWLMGSPEDEIGRDADEPQYEVTLSQDFWMMSTEVTQDLFRFLMGYNPSWLQASNNPVETISWHEAARFANRLTEWHSQNYTPLDACYQCTEDWCTPVETFPDCRGYRLPTEPEWEFAARAGTQTALWTPNGGGNIPDGYQGNTGCASSWSLDDGTPINQLAWFCLNSFDGEIGHRPVGTLTPNAFGLYDMHGNVWEWVHDDFMDYPTELTPDPLNWNNGSSKVVRGGRWAFWAKAIRSAERGNYGATNQRNELGFRLVRTVQD